MTNVALQNKYQDSNVAILEFSNTMSPTFKGFFGLIEDDSRSSFFGEFETALLDFRSLFAFIDGYDILIIKDCRFQTKASFGRCNLRVFFLSIRR